MEPCSVIIRAYNEEKHIGRLLEGVFRQNRLPQEVILVDSGSTDATRSIAASYAAQHPLRVVQISPQEFTFGRSLNRGISDATGELLVFASAHVYPVYPDWLEKLLAPFADPNVAVTYGKQRGGDSTLFSEHQVFRSWYPDQPQAHQAHPFCNNANAAVRKSLWIEHPYDETLPGLEDLEWANWAFQQRRSIVYVPDAEVVHIHHETPLGVRNRYRREAMAFKRIFPQEHFHLADFARLFTGNLFSDLRQAARQKVLKASFASIFWFRWNQFWGTYQGYRQSGPLTWQLKQTFYYPGGSAPTLKPAVRDVEPIQYQEAGKKP